MNKNNGVFVAMGLTLGQQVRLARISRGLRQVDLACMAKVTIADIATLEHDRFLLKTHKRKILEFLGLEDTEAVGELKR